MDDFFEVGLWHQDRSLYEETRALNQSAIKVAYERTMAHAYQAFNEQRTPTHAMEIGTAIHMAILEPELFNDHYAPMPVDSKGARHSKRSGIGKAAWEKFDEEHGTKTPLKQVEIDSIWEIAAAVRRNKIAAMLIDTAKYKEISAYWNHPEYGFKCKGMMDLITIHRNHTWIVDVKTCEDASPMAFRKYAANYGLPIQDHWYREGLHAIAPGDRRFGFLMVEKTPPYQVAFYELGAVSRYEGKHRCDRVARMWSVCLESDQWPGYPQHFVQEECSRWALTHEFEEIDEQE